MAIDEYPDAFGKDTEGGGDMFPVIEILVFLIIGVFLLAFGMHLMGQLDRYISEAKAAGEQVEEDSQ